MGQNEITHRSSKDEAVRPEEMLRGCEILLDVADIWMTGEVNDIRHNTYLLKGEPRERIPEIVRRSKADLLVMGMVCRTGVPGFLIGNTAETALQHVDCSVLTVKPKGFVTPVQS